MSKILKSFSLSVIFMIGLSIGMYYGIDKNNDDVIEEKKPIDSVQDVVIKNVQNENKESGEEINNLEEVNALEEKISPYAKMIIEKKFSKCGHTTMNVLDIQIVLTV